MSVLTSSLVNFLLLSQFLAISVQGFIDSISLCPADSEQEWSYRGSNGPKYWGKTSPECDGKQQSPININTTSAIKDENLEKLTLENYEMPVTKGTIENNGHSIEVVPDDGVVRSVEIDGSKYTLRQFHFHWGTSFNKGSEHTIDQRQYELEVHFVHLNDQGKIAVVGILYKEERTNEEMQKLVKHFRSLKYKGDTTDLRTELILQNFLPENPMSYYRYMGSLTTPGCHEGVTWSVSPTILSVGKWQMFEFRKLFSTTKPALPTCTIANNFRPVQLVNDRTVSLSQ